jgi:hypothetical protein
MATLTRHHVEIQVPELHISGVVTENLHCEITLKGETVKAKYPQDKPAQFEVSNLTDKDVVKIKVMENRNEVGTFEMEMREQFYETL